MNIEQFKKDQKTQNKNPFLGLDVSEDVSFKDAQAVIVPFGYEGTVTFGHGTKNGPLGLLTASAQVETFDDELFDDIHKHIKFWTMKQPILPKEPEKACDLLKNVVSGLIVAKKFPVVVGGEHSISYGMAQALIEHYEDISVLVFDSHLDLGDQWSKRDFTHASWLKYSFKLPNIKKATLVGIRNFNKLEYRYWQSNKDKVKVFLAKNKEDWDIKKIIDSLGRNVYISFDVDAFDASLIPSTGTPEPGGPMWDDVMPVLREVSREKNIIGMDLVELSPIKGFHAPDFIAAKLLMKMLLYKFCSKTFVP